MKLMAMHHVQLTVPHEAEEASRKFYGELLGLEEFEKPAPLKRNGGAWFRHGNSRRSAKRGSAVGLFHNPVGDPYTRMSVRITLGVKRLPARQFRRCVTSTIAWRRKYLVVKVQVSLVNQGGATG
jgi:hypothetical protein